MKWIVWVGLVAWGVVALVWPVRIRDWVLGFQENARGIARWNPFREVMKTSVYIVSIRVLGVIAIGLACVLLVVKLKGSSGP